MKYFIRHLFLIFCFLQLFINSNLLAQTRSWLMSDEELFNNLALDKPDLLAVKTAVEKGDYERAKKELLNYKRGKCSAKWYAEPFIQTDFESAKTDIRADSICDNYIKDNVSPSNPYVDGWIYMGADFDWLHNPREKTDPAYSKQWTWTVGRTIFWNNLADAYRSTQNDKYALKWIWFLSDFITDNPLESYSTKEIPLIWRPLETAIRIRTWVYCYFTFRNSVHFSAEDNVDYLKAIYAHATLLASMQLEYPERTANHVTTECAALYSIGCVFPEFKSATSWRSIGIERFSHEIAKVVPPDGLQAELSPSYHYGVVNAYRNVFNIAKLNDIELSEHFVAKLKDMYRAPVLIMDQWGDFVKTNDSNPRNIRKESRAGLGLENDSLLLWAASNGKEGVAPPTSNMLEYAGFYMMRSTWEEDGVFLFFRGGPQGIAHAEQDMLQIVLKAWNETLLFDPGKYPYDQSDWRRFSINTPSHNTIIVDGKWQYREKPKVLEYKPVDNPWHVSPLFDFVSATYDAGYVTNIYDQTKDYHPQKWLNDRDTTVAHTRSVLYLKPFGVFVLDQLQGSGEHTFDAHFHIDASDAVFYEKEHLVRSVRNSDVQLALYSLENDKLQTEIIKGQQQPLLGWYPQEHKPIPTIRYRKQQETPAVFATFLYPYKENAPSFKFEQIALNKLFSGFCIQNEEELSEFIFTKNQQPDAFSFQSKSSKKVSVEASGVVIREINEVTYKGGWNMMKYKDKNIDIDFVTPATATFFQEGKTIFFINTGEHPVSIKMKKPFKQELTLPPNEWMQITKKNIINCTQKPELFKSFIN